MLYSFIYHYPEDWPNHLGLVELHCNSMMLSSTSKAPSEIVLGCCVQLPPELVDPSLPVLVQDFAEIWQEAKTAIVEA